MSCDRLRFQERKVTLNGLPSEEAAQGLNDFQLPPGFGVIFVSVELREDGWQAEVWYAPNEYVGRYSKQDTSTLTQVG